MPIENSFSFAWVCVELCDVSKAPSFDLHFYLALADGLIGFHDLEDAGASARTKIKDGYRLELCELLKGGEMAFSQVYNMDVIADPGAIRIG